MENIKYRDLSETAVIKAKLQSNMVTVNNIYKDHIRPMESLKKETEIIRTVILNAPSL